MQSRLVLASASIILVACSDAAGPRPLPTVLIDNATCDQGRCATLEIRAYIWKFEVPFQPWGEGLLGYAPPGMSCFTFPPSWSMTISGPDSTGRIDTLVVTWTPADTVPIYLIALDSVYFHSVLDSTQADSLYNGFTYFDGLTVGSVGETPNFTPRSAPGWGVSYPKAPRWTAAPVPTASCKA